MLAEAHIVATKSDIEDCHRLGKNGSTIKRFVNWKFCNDILGKKLTYTKILTSLNLILLMALKFVIENLTPYNQHLPWKCRELKRAKKIHKVWSMKGVIKIRQSSNEWPYSIYNDDIRYLFPDFIFKESNTPK